MLYSLYNIITITDMTPGKHRHLRHHHQGMYIFESSPPNTYSYIVAFYAQSSDSGMVPSAKCTKRKS